MLPFKYVISLIGDRPFSNLVSGSGGKLADVSLTYHEQAVHGDYVATLSVSDILARSIRVYSSPMETGQPCVGSS